MRTRLEDRGDGRCLSFLEACMRAYVIGAAEPMLASSGREDYFLCTYDFNRGKYYNGTAGLT